MAALVNGVCVCTCEKAIKSKWLVTRQSLLIELILDAELHEYTAKEKPLFRLLGEGPTPPDPLFDGQNAGMGAWTPSLALRSRSALPGGQI